MPNSANLARSSAPCFSGSEIAVSRTKAPPTTRYSVGVKRFSTVLLLLLTLLIVAVFLVLNHETSTTNEAPSSSATIMRPSDAVLSHIAYVYDGDTLYLQPDGTTARADEIKVRLIGINTPELRPAVECFAVEARDYLRRLLPKGTEVWTKPDREALDQYGRSLLYLWTKDGQSINLKLVEKGYARALNIAPSNTYAKQFDAAESAARSAGAGLWGTC